MNIVVCVKQVPDTWAEKKLSDSDKTVDREGVEGVMNELDEYAVEEALRIKEAQGGEGTVTVLTMGPEKAVETIRKALSMGADAAVHLVDDGLHGSDALTTSYALAKALGTIEHDLVILGVESTDARMSVIPAMLAERTGAAQLTFARKVEVDDGNTVKIERQTDTGYDVVEGSTPGDRVGRREDQRAALPVVQGHHGRQEEAADDPDARRRRHRGRQRRPRRLRLEVAEFAARPPQAGRSDRQGRGRRWREARRVPRVPEDRLRRSTTTWLRYSFSSSTSTAPRRRSPSSC